MPACLRPQERTDEEEPRALPRGMPEASRTGEPLMASAPPGVPETSMHVEKVAWQETDRTAGGRQSCFCSCRCASPVLSSTALFAPLVGEAGGGAALLLLNLALPRSRFVISISISFV